MKVTATDIISSMVRYNKNADCQNKRLPLFLNTKIRKVDGHAQCLNKKKALKKCIKKMRRINDPESQLHRTVLLNNKLQRIPTTELSCCCNRTKTFTLSDQINDTSLDETMDDIVEETIIDDIFAEMTEIDLQPPLSP